MTVAPACCNAIHLAIEDDPVTQEGRSKMFSEVRGPALSAATGEVVSLFDDADAPGHGMGCPSS